MARRFLYASTTSYGEHIYKSLKLGAFSDIFALTVLVNKQQNGVLAKKPFARLYLKLSQDQRASNLVNRHFSLGIWQFYLPIRNRIIKIPATNFELTFLGNRYTRRLNKILPLVDIAVVASDFALEKIRIPATTKVYLECRSVHKGLNSVRPRIELVCPFEVLEEGPGIWEKQFESRKYDFEGLVTYSSISAESFTSVGVPLDNVLLAPLPVNKVLLDTSVIREPMTLLWVGRGYPSKGLDIAVQVSTLLEVKLTVVGALQPKLITWLQQFPNVLYLGRLDRNKVFKQMQKNEVLIVPTIESYGLAVYEALESGMKVVTSPFVGINEWLDGNPNLFICEEFQLQNFIFTTKKALSSKAVIMSPEIPLLETWRNVLSRL
jgi:glycosyltransferase involved in cell wall biosynthesis